MGRRSDKAIIQDALALHAMWKARRLGGDIMPEDVHPSLGRSSDKLALYFTLGMSLNYQRNSYALWRACTAMFDDPTTSWAFDPVCVVKGDCGALAEALLRHRVALQPNRHPQIWRRNAEGLLRHADASVETLFRSQGYDLGAVREFIQTRKSDFPYLCGPKIANYWLYVMSSYFDWPILNRAALSVAPDRHVIAASLKLGLVAAGEAHGSALAERVAQRWQETLSGAALLPIDLHTPLWLWSRANFPQLSQA
jgi:hypothetical protein